MIDSTFFTLSINKSVAHLVMNRPEKANAMNDAFWDELPLIIQELDQDPGVRALVISGEGKHFSSGIDFTCFDFILEAVKQEPSRAAFAMRKKILDVQHSFNVLEQARFPVIAAIHGVCMGGAVDLISACDLRIAASDSAFSIEEVNIGMAADVGTLQRLPKIIAPGIVKELAFTGRKFSAQEAHSWGLLNAIHANGAETLDAALTLAQDIASKSPVAIAGIKKTIDYARDHSVADSLEQIATWNAGMFRLGDLNQAIEARKQKKQAIFDNLADTRNFNNP